MEDGWISSHIGGRAQFPGFRVLIWCGGAQVTAAPSLIKPSRLHPHLDNDVKKFVGVVWLSKTSYGGDGGDLWIFMELYRPLFLLPRLGCGLVDPFCDFPSVSDNIRTTQGGNAAVARHQLGLEEDERHLKVFVVIFVFLDISYCSMFL
jgi:hypothetical protein